jgi:hypothetical protein
LSPFHQRQQYRGFAGLARSVKHKVFLLLNQQQHIIQINPGTAAARCNVAPRPSGPAVLKKRMSSLRCRGMEQRRSNRRWQSAIFPASVAKNETRRTDSFSKLPIRPIFHF